MWFHILTWGCQMNEHDSEKLAGSLAALGWGRAASTAEADLILLNTCAVREKAAEKVYAELGRLRPLRRNGSGPIIGLCGCVGPLEGEEVFTRAPWVDFVLGPRAHASLPAAIEEARSRRRSIDVAFHQESILQPGEIAERGAGPRAYVTIIEGCNKPCSFCVVPRTRGPEASRPLEEILREVEGLAERGFREIEFLGQTVNAYRAPGGGRLSALLRAASAVEGIERMRFTTSHPVNLTDDLVEAMASLPKVCPHIHMPAQAGSSRVLRRMRRGYDREGYLRRVESLQRGVPGIEISTDVIVGFPGESEADFQETLTLLEEVRFATVYAFVYSPRPGTEAAALDGVVSRAEADERLARLLARQRCIQEEANRAWVGREVQVLVDGPSRKSLEEWTGRTPENRIVNFRDPSRKPGDLVPVRVSAAHPYSLRGAPIP